MSPSTDSRPVRTPYEDFLRHVQQHGRLGPEARHERDTSGKELADGKAHNGERVEVAIGSL